MNMMQSQIYRKIVSILPLLWVIFMFGCNQSQEGDQIAKVRILYLPENATTSAPVLECNDIFYYSNMLKDTTIKEDRFLQSFSKELHKLERCSEEKAIDLRIKCEITYKSESVSVLCLGAYFNTVLDGVLVEDNPTLLRLIKEKIYR